MFTIRLYLILYIKRYIYFNNKAKQCIAINKYNNNYYSIFSNLNLSNKELFMIKSIGNSRPRFKYRYILKNSFSSKNKTIILLFTYY